MKKTIVKDQNEYFKAPLATKYQSTAGSQEKIDPELLSGYLKQLDENGYFIIENMISREQCQEIKQTALALFEHESGRNNFEGFKTQRLYATFEKTLICNDLVDDPLVLNVLDELFHPNYLLSQLQIINILPGEAQQPLHHDDAFYDIPRPRKPLGAATIFAIDDFTETNGATTIIPGSHKWGNEQPLPNNDPRQIPVIMPAGSMLFFSGTLWHGGGANQSDNARMCVTAQYCDSWLRPQENYSLSISKATVKQCSEHIQRMLGYSIHPPFLGFVNGMHPKRLLED
ncbi:MAG: phytanoyl-CoA dioxygenase family protein [Candidatus Pelagadaptatus aseana]|uniref:phytanoyl-CoA dioxygenase family protein n=1 Tax=Candidatus Pelagadaptatus aseana TaxID=3120508 RepID=UPI0039B1B810